MNNVHFQETKKQILELASKILLDDQDLELDNSFFSLPKQKVSNMIIADHFRNIANERLQEYEDLGNSEDDVESYRENLIEFLQDVMLNRT